jgi:hypothetical protein
MTLSSARTERDGAVLARANEGAERVSEPPDRSAPRCPRCSGHVLDGEAVAARIVELLDERLVVPRGRTLIDAGELARRLGVTRDYVYAHALELGAWRLGHGPKARLRFDPEEAERAFTCSRSRGSVQTQIPAKRQVRRRRRPGSSGTKVELLPIKGSQSRENGRFRSSAA